MMGDGFPGWVRQLEGDTGKQTCLQRCGPPTNNSVTVYADVGLWVSPFVSLVNITKPYKFSVLRQPSDTYVVRNDCITPDTFIIASVELSSELKTAMMIVQYKQIAKATGGDTTSAARPRWPIRRPTKQRRRANKNSPVNT